MFMSIEPTLVAVFVPVSDMSASIAWYSHLLGLDTVATTHEGLIYELPLTGSTTVMLDAHGSEPIIPSTKPLLMFDASAIESALALARSLSESVTVPEDVGSAIVFYLTDPDGHRICVKVPKV
jgi:catechol 2,3-dioxygenase-like lactoylglutathione lyase family enzyme